MHEPCSVTARQVSLGLPPPSTSSPEHSPGTWQASPKVFVTIPLSYQHLFPVLFPCCPGSKGGGDLFTFLELGFNRPRGSESLSTIFARQCCNQSPKLRGSGASLLRACGRRHRRQLSRGGKGSGNGHHHLPRRQSHFFYLLHRQRPNPAQNPRRPRPSMCPLLSLAVSLPNPRGLLRDPLPAPHVAPP